jgi:predicted Zn-dependent protease
MNKTNKFLLTSIFSFMCVNSAFALTASPKQIQLLIKQADEEKQHGKIEQAVKDYQEVREMTLQVIKEHPDSSKAYHYLAQIDHQLGKDTEAQNELKKARQLESQGK